MKQQVYVMQVRPKRTENKWTFIVAWILSEQKIIGSIMLQKRPTFVTIFCAVSSVSITTSMSPNKPSTKDKSQTLLRL